MLCPLQIGQLKHRLLSMLHGCRICYKIHPFLQRCAPNVNCHLKMFQTLIVWRKPLKCEQHKPMQHSPLRSADILKYLLRFELTSFISVFNVNINDFTDCFSRNIQLILSSHIPNTATTFQILKYLAVHYPLLKPPSSPPKLVPCSCVVNSISGTLKLEYLGEA